MKIRILFAASECVPFVKTGGLADVVGSLPKYFDRNRYDVRVILPLYKCIAEKYRSRMKYLTHFYTGFNFRDQYVGIHELEEGGVTFWFIDSEFYFSGENPYGYMDQDIEKFAFFSRMVLSALPLLNWKPDIIHCHDWQTGLIPVYLNDSFQGDLFFHEIRTVFTIHNLKFQGIAGIDEVKRQTGLSDYYFTSDKLESYGAGNLLKGGLVFSDRITTVSKTYSKEIRTPFYGERMDGLLNAKAGELSGIVNGIDTSFYDPETDNALAFPFSAGNSDEGKARNKAALQRELGLQEDPDAFLLGIVSRLTDQKGMDLIACVMDEICVPGVQLAVLGTGSPQYEDLFRTYASRFPDRVSTSLFYSEELSHRIYAGCDAFLMPSLFEPCGLSQLMALRYGTLPIVRETGGLKDTVIPYNEYTDEGTGFSFTNFNAHEMLGVIRYARSVFTDRRKNWNDMVKRAMEADFSWNASAGEYEKIYEELYAEKCKAEGSTDK